RHRRPPRHRLHPGHHPQQRRQPHRRRLHETHRPGLPQRLGRRRHRHLPPSTNRSTHPRRALAPCQPTRQNRRLQHGRQLQNLSRSPLLLDSPPRHHPQIRRPHPTMGQHHL